MQSLQIIQAGSMITLQLANARAIALLKIMDLIISANNLRPFSSWENLDGHQA